MGDEKPKHEEGYEWVVAAQCGGGLLAMWWPFISSRGITEQNCSERRIFEPNLLELAPL
jgi:hypothetical protein